MSKLVKFSSAILCASLLSSSLSVASASVIGEIAKGTAVATVAVAETVNEGKYAIKKYNLGNDTFNDGYDSGFLGFFGKYTVQGAWEWISGKFGSK